MGPRLCGNRKNIKIVIGYGRNDIVVLIEYRDRAVGGKAGAIQLDQVAFQKAHDQNAVILPSVKVFQSANAVNIIGLRVTVDAVQILVPHPQRLPGVPLQVLIPPPLLNFRNGNGMVINAVPIYPSVVSNNGEVQVYVRDGGVLLLLERNDVSLCCIVTKLVINNAVLERVLDHRIKEVQVRDGIYLVEDPVQLY